MMHTEERTEAGNSIKRLAFVAVSVLAQVVWLLGLFMRLNEYSATISLISTLLAVVLVLRLYAGSANAAFKMPWIIIIMAFPVMGVSLYLLMGHTGVTRGMERRFHEIDRELFPKLEQEPATMEKLRSTDPAVANQAYYIWKYGKYPIYRNTEVTYYGEAAEGLAAQKEALEKAERFIFMEYHAIEDGEAFGGLREILVRKARAGVEVRVFYDDIGSVGFLNHDFIRRMEADGIQCRVFNPLLPVLNVFMNNRDHRKITVVDGRVGFTGGYNLATQYFCDTERYGHWKDTGLRLEGDGVRTLTVLFLEMWNAIRKTDSDYDRYLTEVPGRAEARGYVQPYGDSPLDEEPMGENVYMNMVKNARQYVYFTTPYLIISDEFRRELGMAAKRGVDVRLITPGIPDKKMVYRLTRSYYAGLVKDGVRIYEYTPGFLHAKQCVCDGETAVVGTINLDYRSLYMHFENGVFLYDCEAVDRIKENFDEMFPVSEEVTEKYRSGRSAMLRISQCILRLGAPLM